MTEVAKCICSEGNLQKWNDLNKAKLYMVPDKTNNEEQFGKSCILSLGTKKGGN